jgi:hypothetical protein
MTKLTADAQTIIATDRGSGFRNLVLTSLLPTVMTVTRNPPPPAASLCGQDFD